MKIVYPNAPHWVGDGFFVRTLLDIQRDATHSSPFLMMDYGAPKAFLPRQHPHGVGQHPHRGFETVTLVLQGEIAHRDTAGHYDIIRTGGVQWMTAGNGIMHQEFQSEAFAQAGGIMEMVQIWVNLPSQYKRVPPRYQSIQPEEMVKIKLYNNADYIGEMWLIAGEYQHQSGKAKTYSPLFMAYIELLENITFTLPIFPNTWQAQMAFLSGNLAIGQDEINQSGVVYLDKTPQKIKTTLPSKLVLLAGEPLNEPIAHYGPFVMNTREELQETFRLYQSGKFGKII